MKKFLTLLLLISNIMIANESKRDGFSLPTLIGEGSLKVLWWEVYDVRLLTDETSFSWKKKFMLEFEYKREVKKNDTIESSLKEFQRQVNITEKEIDDWQVYLEQVIQSVQQETKATVEWDPRGKITFHYEGNAPITIENEDFAKAFFNIWLGEETSQPELRSQLLALK